MPHSPLPIVLLSTLKNGNLVANALVGVVILGKRYSIAQWLCVAVVSAGLVATALPGAGGGGGESETPLDLGLEGTVAVAW